MSEKGDDLDTLSNAELHLKCLQNGMKNIPVTDASRGVLIKRLRAALSGITPDTPTKQNKRYSEAPKVAEKVAEDKSKRTNRRTIAVTKSIGTDETVDGAVAATTAIPTKKREGSVQKVLPVTIIDEIEIESDDDLDLVKATARAEAAEHGVPVRGRTTRSVSVTKSNIPVPVAIGKKDVDTIIEEQEVEPVVRKRSTRSVSLSKSSVVTVSFDGNVPPIQEEPVVSTAPITQKRFDVYAALNKKEYEPVSMFKEPTNKSEQRYSQPVTTTTGYAATDTSKYASSSRYTIAPAIVGTPSLLIGKTSAYFNEQSDDTDTEPYDTPYLSSFARELELLKSDPHLRRMSSDVFSPRARTGIVHKQRIHPPIWEQLRNLLRALDNKYHIRRNVFFAFVGLAVVFFIYVFWR